MKGVELLRVFNAQLVGRVKTVAGREYLIMVIDTADDRAQNLKELIQFMDAPAVCIAAPDNWQVQVGEHRLAAIFLGENLPHEEFAHLIDEIGKFDPNIPIVLVAENPHV